MWNIIVEISSILGLLVSLILVYFNVQMRKRIAEIQGRQMLRVNVELYIEEYELCLEILNDTTSPIPINLLCKIEQAANGILEYGGIRKKYKRALIKLKETAKNNEVGEARSCINAILPWLKNIKDRKDLSI